MTYSDAQVDAATAAMEKHRGGDTGEVGAVYSVDGHLQESMRGTARVQAMSADGSRLYVTDNAGGTVLAIDDLGSLRLGLDVDDVVGDAFPVELALEPVAVAAPGGRIHSDGHRRPPLIGNVGLDNASYAFRFPYPAQAETSAHSDQILRDREPREPRLDRLLCPGARRCDGLGRHDPC